MPDDVADHANRARAESFGQVAAAYDRFRPGYPEQLIDDLVALRPGHVLDVGCGTGKAARLLQDRGLRILGVEVDPQMAAVARAHGVPVEVASFESWDDAGRRFGLITSAQAWHWIDPAVGAPKAARLLDPGGVLVAFWNFDDLGDERVGERVDTVYRDLAPELRGSTTNRPGDRLADLVATGVFASVKAHTYTWERSVSVEDWVGKLGTQSDHLLLGADRLVSLQTALRTALAGPGGQVRLVGGTYSIWARP